MSLFFIVGTGRCGTQMLRNIINQWEGIVVVPETHFIIPLYDKYGLNKVEVEGFLTIVEGVLNSAGRKWIEVILDSSVWSIKDYRCGFKNYLEDEQIQGGIREFVEGFFRFLYGEDKIFGDKTPHYGANIDIILKIWPEAKVVHLLRDCLPTVRSMQNHPGFVRFINGRVAPENLDRIMMFGKQLEYSEKKPNLNEALSFWIDLSLKNRQKLKCVPKDQLITIKYEELILEPTTSIDSLHEFLDLYSKKGLLKSKRIPRPFPSYKYEDFMDADSESCMLVENLREEMGYPYVTPARSFKWYFREALRGRNFYYKSFIKVLKHIIKNAIR